MMIMNKFRGLQSGNIVLMQTILALQKTSPIISLTALKDAINVLITDGYLEFKITEPDRLYLTNRGFSFLNP